MLTLVSSVFNEEFLLPWWIRWHKQFADDVIMIDFRSTDGSKQVWDKMAPKHWRWVDTKCPNYAAVRADEEIMEWEQQIAGYKMYLCVTEFLLLGKGLELLDAPTCYAMPAVTMVDPDMFQPALDYEQQLPEQRQHATWDAGNERWGYRFLHNLEHGDYQPGRHKRNGPFTYTEDAMVLWYGFSPWPQSIPRKLQVQTQIPNSDYDQGYGVHHRVSSEELWEKWARKAAFARPLTEYGPYKRIMGGA